MKKSLLMIMSVSLCTALHAQQANVYTLSKESMGKAITRYGLALHKVSKNKDIIAIARQIQAFALQNNSNELPEGCSKILEVHVDPEKLEVEKELAELQEEMLCDFPDFMNQISEKIKAEELWEKLLNFSNLVLLGAQK